MDTSLLMQKAAEYTQKFVDAAVPVAKKAYEIGLLTIQIDGIQQLITAFIALIFSIFLWRKCHKMDDDWWKNTPVPWFGCSASLGLAAFSAFNLFNVWIWVKLFHPELWLAKQAIEKVLEVATN